MTFLTKLPRTTPKRFELFPELEDMRREMESFFNQFERRVPRFLPTNGEPWMPFVDVFEKEGNIVVMAELPGLERKDIKVYVTDGTLVIEGERKHVEKVEKENWYRHEMSWGEFVRRIDLPEGVKPEEIQAEYKAGILEVRIPKVPIEKPKEIPIQVS